VEERPVPAGDVPGEHYSPTQPIPVLPRPVTRTQFTRADLVGPEDTTPEHAAAVADLWTRSGGLLHQGPYTPFKYHKAGDPPASSVQMPGGIGGVNWGGVAVDPTTGWFYLNAHNAAMVGWIEDRRPGVNYSADTVGATFPYERGSVDGPGPYYSLGADLGEATGANRTPGIKPSWGVLIAINANSGATVWEVPLGLSEELPEGKQLTGRSLNAGPMVTASGLLFIGATLDRRFRAFDATTGEEVWSYRLEAPADANPITYLGSDGRQYVAVIARDTLVSFALADP
jgi:quinoprotein glucose dehydrogenase